MNVIRFLRAWKAKIQKGWCKGAGARDKNGREVSMSSPKAAKFCLLAAKAVLRKKYGPWTVGSDAETIWHEANNQACCLDDFNDGHSKKAVLASLDKAIELAKQKEKQ